MNRALTILECLAGALLLAVALPFLFAAGWAVLVWEFLTNKEWRKL